ncbi:nuclear transport factor 2 family protein [Nonomuraea rosea]|uniref:Nuclear transport factor 2 family protein n=1 Tax=Nonomuraea rosea TaxID=638574 RepID=A0ABP6YNR3_9ACTN
MQIHRLAGNPGRAGTSAVMAGDRGAWLSCYADDAVLYDPVGGSPLDAQGAGVRGLDGLDRFWRQGIAPNQVRFDVTAVHAAGDEAAVVATVPIRFPNDGVFVCTINHDNQVVSLRGYWDVQRVLSALSA